MKHSILVDEMSQHCLEAEDVDFTVYSHPSEFPTALKDFLFSEVFTFQLPSLLSDAIREVAYNCHLTRKGARTPQDT